MVLNLLDGNLPSLDGVALLASGTELALVNIGMASGTRRGDIREHQLGVAGHAGHFFVHAAQRIFCLVMVKLGDAADWLPSTEGVAVLARNIQGPVWTSSGLAALLGRYAKGRHQREDD